MSQGETPRDEFDDQIDEQLDDEPDEFEEAINNCRGFLDAGFFVCAAAGSEDCDWECPFSRDLGLTVKQIEEREFAEEE